MARDTPVLKHTGTETELPNLVTVIGHGDPSNYEITVDGEIRMIDADHDEEAVIISGGTAEGSVDVGVQRFRFSGQMANVQVVDSTGIEATNSRDTPTVNIKYGGC